ncbi:MAG: chaperone modulator CbpM [Bacteroidales bacterium]
MDEFCTSHNIGIAFISTLEQTGLIEISTIDDAGFIEAGHLLQLEQILRFYYDLDINVEGIETITHLLQRIKVMQEEIISLRNRLNLYESSDQA